MASRLLPNPSDVACVISMPPAGCSLPSSQNTTSRKVWWMSMAITPSHLHRLPDTRGEPRGLHDNYRVALSTQPGESQRRPGNNSSFRLIHGSACPHLHCSRCLRPDSPTTLNVAAEHRHRQSYRLKAGQKEIPDVLDPITGHAPSGRPNAQVHCHSRI
jgi:hypothetical protein